MAIKPRLCCLIRGCYQCGHCMQIYCMACIFRMKDITEPGHSIPCTVCPNCNGISAWKCINTKLESIDRISINEEY